MDTLTPSELRQEAGLPSFNVGGPGTDRESLSLGKIVTIAYRRRAFILIWTLTLVVLAALAIRSLTPWYRADASVAVDMRQLQFGELSVNGPRTNASPDNSFVRTQVAIVASDAIARRVIDDLKLAELPGFSANVSAGGMLAGLFGGVVPFGTKEPSVAETPSATGRLSAALDIYARSLQASNDSRSYIINITFSWPDAELSQKIVNRHAEYYIATQKEAKVQALDSATGWLDREVKRLREQLMQAEKRVQDYRVKYHLLSLSKIEPSVQQKLANAVEQLETAEADFKERMTRTGQAGGPDVEIARQHRDGLIRTIADYEDSIAGLERRRAGVEQLEREASAQRSLYEAMLGRQKLIETQVGIQQADAFIVSRADLPRRPYYPSRSLLLTIAFMLSAGSAVGISVGLDRLKKGYADARDVERSLGLRVYGAFPRVRGAGSDNVFNLSNKISLHTASTITARVRGLRNALTSQCSASRRVVALVSCNHGEGTTSVTLALARSLVQSGQRVLVIEANLLTRSLGQIFCGHGEQPGLIAVAQGKTTLESAVRPDLGDGGSYDILPAEDDAFDPRAVLPPDVLQRIVSEAVLQYDYVLIDAPPIGIAFDAMPALCAADFTLLVLAAGRGSRVDLERHIRDVSRAGIHLGGAVLNFVLDDSKSVASRRSLLRV